MYLKTNLVSVIMNCHNGAKYLKDSISSLEAQTHQNWELIFFNNCSNDKSEEIIKSCKNKKIRYFFSKKKLNLYQARNLAIKKARGNYISFLDTDDEWDKNKLLNQLNFFKKNKDYSIIYSNYYLFYKKKKFKQKKFKELLPSGNISQDLINKYVVGILTVMIKSNLLKKNKFNEKFNIIGDFDLFFKLSQKYLIGYIEKPLAFYRIHPDNLSKKTKMHINELDIWIRKNKENLKKKNYDLFKIKFYLFKLKIKNLLKNFGLIFD